MQKKDPERERVFLRYFLRTYIPPCTIEIPPTEEIFQDIYLSAHTVWLNFKSDLDRYSFSQLQKNKLLKLFELWETLWEKYLSVPTYDLEMGNTAYSLWVKTPQIHSLWSDMQILARDLDLFGKMYYQTDILLGSR